jgi:hypothetical protein
MAWQRFRVQLKGDGEPVDVQTAARDWAGVRMDPGQPRAMDMTFQVVHAALVRTGHDVPRDYDGFLEVLDGMPDALDAEDTELLDPTGPTRLDG